MTPLIYSPPIVNVAMSTPDMIAILVSQMPEWDWQCEFERGGLFQITGQKGWHRIYIDRRPDGTISHTHHISKLWCIATLGIAYVAGMISGVGYSPAIELVLRNHVHGAG